VSPWRAGRAYDELYALNERGEQTGRTVPKPPPERTWTPGAAPEPALRKSYPRQPTDPHVRRHSLPAVESAAVGRSLKEREFVGTDSRSIHRRLWRQIVLSARDRPVATDRPSCCDARGPWYAQIAQIAPAIFYCSIPSSAVPTVTSSFSATARNLLPTPRGGGDFRN